MRYKSPELIKSVKFSHIVPINVKVFYTSLYFVTKAKEIWKGRVSGGRKSPCIQAVSVEKNRLSG